VSVAPGQTFSMVRECDRYRSLYYAGASGDFNPIHIDVEVGQAVGLGGVILQGLCTLAWGVDAFARFLGDPGLVTGVKARFSKPVRPEDTVRFDGTVTEVSGGVVRAIIVARNQSGDEVLKNVVVEGRVGAPRPSGAQEVPGMTAEVAQAAEVLRLSRSELLEETRLPAASGRSPARAGAALSEKGPGRTALGKTWGPFRYVMGAEKMREYAVAISGGVPSYISTGLPEHLHPVLHDEEAAARSPWGSMIAFPMFAVLFSIAPAQAALLDPAMEVDVFRVLHGEQEFEFREALRPGDVLLTTGTLESHTVRGNKVTFVIRTDSVNQHGRIAVRGRFTAFVRG
jgi:3-hydroxybutyryl-CoA dehydratase